MFKFEYHVKSGIFLAPKSYMLETEENISIIKHKGPAKELVTSERFKNQLADPEETTIQANFRIDWKKRY